MDLFQKRDLWAALVHCSTSGSPGVVVNGDPKGCLIWLPYPRAPDRPTVAVKQEKRI